MQYCDHKLKIGYAGRVVQSGYIIEPFSRDRQTAKEIVESRNDAIYTSPTNA